MAWLSSAETQSSCSNCSTTPTSTCPRSAGNRRNDESIYFPWHSRQDVTVWNWRRKGANRWPACSTSSSLGPTTVHRCITYYRDKSGDLINEPNARPQASFVDDLKAAISTSRTKAKVVFMPLAKYQYLRRIDGSPVLRQTLESGRSLGILR